MVWERIFLVYLGFFPFVVWNQSYEAPKVVWLFSGSALLCLLWLTKLRDKIPDILKTYDLLYFGWLLILIVASLLGVHPWESIIGGSYRHQGVIFFFGLWLVGKTIAILSGQSRRNLVKIIIFWTAAESLLALIRPLGTLGEKNAVAGFLAMAASFAPNYLLLLPVGAIAVLTSRSGILAFLPVAISRFKRLPKILFVALIPIALFVFISAEFYRPALGVEDRRLLAKIAIGQISKKPLIGYGAETGEVLYDNYFKSIKEPLSGIIIDRSHNLVLDLLLWSGVVGLSLFAVWFFVRTKELFVSKKWDRLAGVASFLIFSFLQPLGVVHWLLLMIVFDL